MLLAKCYLIYCLQRTVALRFLYPVYYIPEVEITPNQFTSPQVIEKGKSCTKTQGRRGGM